MMEEEEETLFDQENLLGQHDPDISFRDRSELKRKVVKTGALSMAFFCLGLCIAIPGATLIELGRLVGRSTNHMVLVFTARSVGFLLGSVAGGPIGDILDQQILLALVLGATALATVLIPWSSTLFTMAGLISVQGAALGVLNSGGNVFCIRIWGKQSPSYMQVLHFAFGIGAFLAPLLARPFLGEMTSIILGANQSGVASPYFYEVQAFNQFSESAPDSGENESLKGNLTHLNHNTKRHAWISHRMRRDTAVGDKLVPESTTGVYDASQGQNKTAEPIIQSTLNGTLPGINNTTTTAVPTPPKQVIKKPDHIDSGSLNPSHADGERNKAKLEELVHNKHKDPNLGNPASAVTALEVATTAPMATKFDLGGNVEYNGTDFRNDSLPHGSVDDSQGMEPNTNESGTLIKPQPVEGSSAPPSISRTTLGPVKETTSTTSTTQSTSTTPSTTTSSTPLTSTSTTTTTTTTTNTPTSTTSTTTTPTSTASTTTSTTLKPSQDLQYPSSSSESDPQSGSQDSETLASPNSSESSPGSESTIDNNEVAKNDSLHIFIETVRNMSKIQVAYLAIGLLLGANTVMFASLYCRDRAEQRSGPLMAELSHEDLTRPPRPMFFAPIFLGMLFLFFLTYVGTEVTCSGLLPTFALDLPGVVNSQAQAATLVALFWGSFAFGRGMAIFVARCFKPPCMMVINLCVTMAGAILLVAGVSADPRLLWAGTGALGLGLSSLFPTTLSWANAYYPLSGRAAAVIVAGSGIGEMTIPALTGQLYHNFERMVFLYVILILAGVLVLLFSSLQIMVCYLSSRKGHQRSHSGFMRLENSEDLDMDLLDADETELGGTDIQEGNLGDLASVTRRKRAANSNRAENGEQNRTNGTSNNRDNGYEVTEFTKLVELSD